ncbi:MAG: hypothetical protein V7767_15195, partial [Leeuwenhoekiella sp.]
MRKVKSICGKKEKATLTSKIQNVSIHLNEIKCLKEKIQELLFTKEFQLNYILALEKISGQDLSENYMPDILREEILS